MTGNIRLAFLIGLAMQTVACAPTHKVFVQADAVQQSGKAPSRKTLDVIGYTTRDGQHQEFRGTVQLAGGGYYFRPYSNTSAPFTLSRDQIESFDIVESTPASGLAVVILTTAALLVGLFLVYRGAAGPSG